MKKLIILLLLTITVTGAKAQTINLYFPHFAGQEYDFYIFRGLKTDTLQSGVIPDEGWLTISVENYRGMARWLLRSGGGLDFVLNGENFSVSCTETNPNDENIFYKNSPENDFFYESFFRSQAIFQKLDAVRMGIEAYGKEPDNSLYPLLELEQENLEKALADLNKEMVSSPLYAARFRRFDSFLNGWPIYALSEKPDEQLNDQVRFVEEELSIDDLYTSGLWRDLITQSIGLYENESGFMESMITNLKRTHSPAAYTQLAEDLIDICEQYGWQEEEERLINFLINDGRVKEPTDKLKMLMSLFKLSKNSPAPQLLQGKLPAGKTLLVFYESGCGSCENEMEQLKANYPLLKEKGYEVVSVSADTDEAVFRNTAESFPWKEKYCDLKGFEGDDFKNYGVIGTPTFYLIDKAGIVQGRYARLLDTEIL